MDAPDSRPQGHAPDIPRWGVHLVVPPADAFIEDELIIHIGQEPLNNAAGQDYAVRSLDFDIDRNRTDFIVWPREKRIYKPF
jgi:hypothetical protein